MNAPATTTERYRPINKRSLEQGCGRQFYELRTYIEDTQTGKLVRDVGDAKYSAERAAELARKMNERAAA